MNIKNKIFKTVFMVTLVSVAVYQNATAQNFGRAGIKGGINVSNLYVDNATDENARLGFNLGVYGQLFSTDAFALQPELLYSTKGSKVVYGGPFNQEIQYNLNYIDLPVLAVIKIGESAEIHLGGYASYLLDANISYKGDLVNGVDQIDKDNLKSYDYGLVGGMGINFGSIQVGARYNYGLVTLADSDAARTWIGNSKNSNAQLFVAFNLNTK